MTDNQNNPMVCPICGKTFPESQKIQDRFDSDACWQIWIKLSKKDKAAAINKAKGVELG